MALTIVSLALVPYDKRLPLPLGRVLYAAGIDQRWPMFGQNPGLYDFRWRVSAERADGQRLDDILPELAPGLLNPARHLTYARWLKLAEALRNPQMGRAFAAYLCRRYNADAATPLQSLDLFLVARDVLPIEQGGSSPPRNHRMLHQDCFATPSGSDAGE